MTTFRRIARMALFGPFERFFRYEASSSIVLLAATVTALAWANSPWRAAYFDLWHIPLEVGVGRFHLEMDLHHWVNDGLMALFFLLVGLEIKREVLTGELSNVRAALLPAAAALGGMVMPALIFLTLNAGTPTANGWGIPMATDIAFAIGTLAILGPRVPPALCVFLAAAAIVDDLGAVLVIALFYTSDIANQAIGWALVLLVGLILVNRVRVRALFPYLLFGLLLWLAVLASGIHATVAGVVLALTIPARVAMASKPDERMTEAVLKHAHRENVEGPRTESERQSELIAAEKAVEAEEAPLIRLEHALVPWVSYGIVPLFAFANAGVTIPTRVLDALMEPLALGIILGLLVGKQIGLLGFPYLLVRTGVARLPEGVRWVHMWGLAWLSGIGFTMSLFIANLGLPAEQVDVAKLGILAASLIAGIGGLTVLRLTTQEPADPAAR